MNLMCLYVFFRSIFRSLDGVSMLRPLAGLWREKSAAIETTANAPKKNGHGTCFAWSCDYMFSAPGATAFINALLHNSERFSSRTTRLCHKHIKKIISLRSIAAVLSPRQPGGSCSRNFRCCQPPSVQHDRDEHGCSKRIYCDTSQGPFADGVSAVKATSDPTNGRTCCCLALRQCEETWGRTQ